jgi:hypothetical protein
MAGNYVHCITIVQEYMFVHYHMWKRSALSMDPFDETFPATPSFSISKNKTHIIFKNILPSP